MRKVLFTLVFFFVISLSFADDDILDYIPSDGKMPVILNHELLTVNSTDFTGKVFVKVAINEKGEIIPGKVNILGEIKNDKAKKMALEVVKKLTFSPAIYNDKPVKCWLTIPVKFVNNNTKMVQH